MVMQFPALGSRRAIIDRRAISDSINALAHEHKGDPMRLRGLIVGELKAALEEGRVEVARRLEQRPTRGRETVTAFAFLIDQILRLLYDATTHHLYPSGNRSTGERIALI
ncbi:MAG: bifunctional uridylyltransferase/uridylyl-removing protein, partial [Alphaproteobacteria bacterium]